MTDEIEKKIKTELKKKICFQELGARYLNSPFFGGFFYEKALFFIQLSYHLIQKLLKISYMVFSEFAQLAQKNREQYLVFIYSIVFTSIHLLSERCCQKDAVSFLFSSIFL